MRQSFRVGVEVIALLAVFGVRASSAQTLLDDRVITIHSAADAVNKRQALINFVWGTDGFPNTTPPVRHFNNQRITDLRAAEPCPR